MSVSIEELKVALKNAIRSHWQKANSIYDDVYGYALFSDDCLESGFGVAFNRTSSLPEDSAEDYELDRYLAVQWNEWDSFSLFDESNAMLNSIFDNDSSWDCRNGILRAAIKAMVELENEGVFGEKSDNRFLTICLSDSDDAVMMDAARALNTEEAFARYSALF